jgi:hypothetical protein
MDTTALTQQPEYRAWLQDLKTRIQQTQIKAAIRVNTELLQLYWQLGAEIVKKQQDAKWGDGFLPKLSQDLLDAFPEMKGFSLTNLRDIRQWYLYYNQKDIIRQQVVGELENNSSINTILVVQESPSFSDVLDEQLFFSIPWGHHIMIMRHCKSLPEAIFYIRSTVENNWSRSVLNHQIDSRLFERQGKGITNFQERLPKPQSDLAQQLIKDPYVFDFLTLRKDYDERELQAYLVENMIHFLLELGKGFCFYGKNVRLDVNGDEFFLDLLFYNAQLHCYIVVELKTVPFKPEHVGQLKFYVTAIDHQLRQEGDNPTLGLLICKDKNDVVAEYALSDLITPIGISVYELYNKLSEGYQASLPTIEEIEHALES